MITKHIFGIASGLACLIVYIKTLYPGVAFIDSGELAAACATFGIPHPTGYPLFLILGYVFSELPLPGSVIYKLNLFTALTTASAVVVAYYTMNLLLNIIFSLKPKSDQKSKKTKALLFEPGMSPNQMMIISFCSAVIFGLSKTIWLDAISIEVYALHSLFISLIVFVCLKIYLNLKTHNKKYWIALFLILGFSLANHSTTVYLFTSVVYLFYLQFKDNSRFAKSLIPYVFFIIPGLLLYLVLVVRSASEPYLNWSNPQTLQNLLNHIRGSDFSQLMFSSSSTFSDNLKLFFGGILNEFAIVPGMIGAAGLILLYKLNKNTFFYFLILIFTCLLFSFNYNTKEIQSFFLVIYFVIPLNAGIGSVFALNFINQKLNFGKNAGLAATIAVCLFLCGFSLVYHYKANDNSDNYVIEDLTLNTLNQLEPNSIVMTYDWAYLYSGSLYYQQVEKIRGDLKIFIVRFLSAPWYLEMIKKYYPDVYNNSKNEIEEYVRSYGGNESLRIQRLNALVKAFIGKNFGKFNVYLTFDFVYNKETKSFISDYNVQPDGLVYRLRSKTYEYDNTAGLKSLQSTFRKYVPNTIEKEKVYISTAGVYYDNAFYHYKNKNPLLAIRFLDKSVELRNDFNDAVNLKNKILAEIKLNEL